MKNNSLAMVATISLVLSIASMISYIDPAVCAGSTTEGFVTCEQAAAQHLWGFWGFMAFGIVTLVAGTIRNQILSKRRED
mgnify:FL=1